MASTTDVSLAFTQTSAHTARPQTGGCDAPIYFLAFAGTRCAYPQTDGQAEFTRMAIPVLTAPDE